MNLSSCNEMKIVTSNQNRDLVGVDVGVCNMFQVIEFLSHFLSPF